MSDTPPPLPEAPTPPPAEEALPPFKYPAWVIAVSAVVFAACVYSLATTPGYLSAARKVNAARAALDKSSFKDAAEYYAEVMEAHPTSKVARLGYARSAFGTKDPLLFDSALTAIEGLELNEHEMEELKTTMPPEVEKAFQQVQQP